MNFNMITSEIELIGNSITNIDVKNNIAEYNNDMSKSFGLDVKDIKIEKHDNKKIGEVVLNIQVEVTGTEDSTFKMDMDIDGAFATELETSDDKFMQLLYINGVSALLGIARGKIETITASVFNSGKISIPFVNVLDYYREITSGKQ